MTHELVSTLFVCASLFTSLLFLVDVTTRESIDRLEKLISRLMAFLQFLRTLRALRA